MHRFSGNGVREIQLPGVKCLTADQIPTGIIKKISDKRMPQILHMNPDLMCAACFQPQSDQGYIFLCIVEDRFVMGDSLLPALKIYATAQSRAFFSGNGCVNYTSVGEISFHNSKIGAPYISVFQADGQDRSAQGMIGE